MSTETPIDKHSVAYHEGYKFGKKYALAKATVEQLWQAYSNRPMPAAQPNEVNRRNFVQGVKDARLDPT